MSDFFLKSTSGPKNLRTASKKKQLGGILPVRGAFVRNAAARFLCSHASSDGIGKVDIDAA